MKMRIVYKAKQTVKVVKQFEYERSCRVFMTTGAFCVQKYMICDHKYSLETINNVIMM